MLRIIAIGFLLTGAGAVLAQDVPVIHPVHHGGCDLSKENFTRYAEFDALLAMEPNTMDSATAARFEVLMQEIGEAGPETPCQILGAGCSWYCGGGPDTVTASSQLRGAADSLYAPMNVHDLDYCTAWCEGVEGNGVGERLIYHFAPDSPRLHTIIVVNGFVQDSARWRENGRVKELLVHDNGKPVARLALDDTMDDQAFKVGLLGRHTDGRAMDLVFEIRAVYPGTRYKNTALTEVYFDGTDVH